MQKGCDSLLVVLELKIKIAYQYATDLRVGSKIYTYAKSHLSSIWMQVISIPSSCSMQPASVARSSAIMDMLGSFPEPVSHEYPCQRQFTNYNSEQCPPSVPPPPPPPRPMNHRYRWISDCLVWVCLHGCGLVY